MRSNVEEARLANAAAQGDGQAFAQLYDRYEKPVYNYCLRLLGNEHDAQDATQDAFVKVMRRLPEMGDRELDFAPYLYTVARNASYDMIGKRKRAEPVDEIADDAGQLMGDGPAIEADPVRSALLDVERDSIRAANARLPERQREVLALREIQGMSYEDIADLLEMNANSVAQLISRARIRLRDELRGEAAGAVAGSSPDCERALPLLARRQDGKLKDGPDREWLTDHIATCATCPLAAEAMAEAGLSYRAWAPVAPAAWLFRDTLAKAADLLGSDWTAIGRPAGPSGENDETEADGSLAEPAGDEGPVVSAATAEVKRRKRRRRLLAGSLGSLFLIALFGGLATGVLGGEAEEPPPAKPPLAETPAQPSPDPPEPNRTTARRDGQTRPQKTAADKPPEPKAETTPTTRELQPPSTAPVSASSVPPIASPTGSDGDPAPSQPERNRRASRDRTEAVGDGTGSWGARARPDRPADPAPSPEPPAVAPDPPAPVPPQPVPPPTAPPPPTRDPVTDPQQPTPPGSPNDPPVDGGQQPPPDPCSSPKLACP